MGACSTKWDWPRCWVAEREGWRPGGLGIFNGGGQCTRTPCNQDIFLPSFRRLLMRAYFSELPAARKWSFLVGKSVVPESGNHNSFPLPCVLCSLYCHSSYSRDREREEWGRCWVFNVKDGKDEACKTRGGKSWARWYKPIILQEEDAGPHSDAPGPVWATVWDWGRQDYEGDLRWTDRW